MDHPYDLVPCPDCGAELARDDEEHECEWNRRLEHLLREAAAELDSGAFLARIDHWLEDTPDARLRREYIAWQEAGCPSWQEWELRSKQA